MGSPVIDARTASEEGIRTTSAITPPPTPCYPGGGVTTAPLANGGLFSSPRPSRSPDVPARGPHTAAHASQRAPRAALGANRAATLASGPPAGALGCARPPRSRVVARSARARRSGRARRGRAWSGRSLRGARAGRWVLASRRALPSPGRAARVAQRRSTHTSTKLDSNPCPKTGSSPRRRPIGTDIAARPTWQTLPPPPTSPEQQAYRIRYSRRPGRVLPLTVRSLCPGPSLYFFTVAQVS